jgi:hypothetical protein
MARKRKNSTALFEVISAGRVDRKPVAAALKTPRWWFKGQSGSAAETSSPAPIQSDPTDPTANVTAETFYRARQRMTPAAPVPASPTSPPAASSAAAPPPVASLPQPAANDAYAAADLQDVGLASAAPGVVGSTAAAGRPPSAAPVQSSTALVPTTASSSRPVAPPSAALPDPLPAARPGSPRAVGRSKFRFDEDSQQVTLKMRYTTAIVTAFSVLVIVGAAYVIGRHLAEGPAQANASDPQQSTARVRKGPAQPGVMDLSRGPGAGPQARLDTTNRPRAQTSARNGPDSGGATPPPAAPPPAAAAQTVYADAHIAPDGTAQRISNMNYLEMINLPPENRQRAYDLRDLMTANGIPCTVEKVSKQRGAPKIPGPEGWYAVVGVRGFSPKYGQLPEYRAYRNAIATAAARIPSKGKFDKIDHPLEFKWSE